MDFDDFDNIPAATESETVYVEEGEEEETLPPAPQVPSVPYVEESIIVAPGEEVSAFDAVYEPIEEDDALTKFHREWNVKLEEKRAKEYEYEKKVRASAQEELDQWKVQREVRLNAKKDKNRTEEAVVVEALNSEFDAFKLWDRVSKLVDLSENPDKKGEDTSRMRKLFIQLKNEPLEQTREQ